MNHRTGCRQNIHRAALDNVQGIGGIARPEQDFVRHRDPWFESQNNRFYRLPIRPAKKRHPVNQFGMESQDNPGAKAGWQGRQHRAIFVAVATLPDK